MGRPIAHSSGRLSIRRPGPSAGAATGEADEFAVQEVHVRELGIPFRRYSAFWLLGVGIVGGTWVVWSTLSNLSTVLGLLAVSILFTIFLTPIVDFVGRRLHVRRGLAVGVVFVLGLAIVFGIGYLFTSPIYNSSNNFTRDLPQVIRDAERGRGEIGRVLKDLGVQGWARDNLPSIRRSLGQSDGPLAKAGLALVSGFVAAVTTMILVFLMLLQAPRMSAWIFALFPEARSEHIRKIGSDAARAVSGYVIGNLVISAMAGTAAYVALRLLGVRFAFVLALWVAFADLLPLIGATLGAIPPIFVALLDSSESAIILLIFFVLYQLFENQVLQTTVMAKTVKLNPLGVLLAVIVGVELAGLLGALMAIPVAGAIQVVVRDVWPEQQSLVEDVLAINAEPET